jgi:hypothetical protein
MVKTWCLVSILWFFAALFLAAKIFLCFELYFSTESVIPPAETGGRFPGVKVIVPSNKMRGFFPFDFAQGQNDDFVLYDFVCSKSLSTLAFG